jgi:hypothetical protein
MDEPNRAMLRMLIELPSWKKSATDIAAPVRRCGPTTLQLDPTRIICRKLMDELHMTKLNAESALPNRPKLRTLTELAKLKKSITDAQLAPLTLLITDNAEPMRTKDRTDNALPKDTQHSADRAEP